MRRVTLALPSLLSLLLLFTLSSLALASEDDRHGPDEDGYEENARVARVSLLRGDVSVRRAGGGDKWERATLNLPLVEGDRLTTGADARLEIQIDARNFLRVGPEATLDVVTLREEGVALSLAEGTATLRLARFEKDREYFEIDAPGTTVAAERRGLYRLDVTRQGRLVRVTVREDGRARVYSETSGFTLRDGRTAELARAAGDEEADWNFTDAASSDSWDSWVGERERYLAERLRHEGRDRYYDSQVWGAEELDSYGDWVEHRDYGYVWRPRTTVINNYYNWAPYRYGHWRWLPAYGWTWIGDEPWGWAPYHYGRWVHVDNYWCWAPRGYVGYHRRSWWRPALVAFVFVAASHGEHVAWYPLPYHHRDPHSNFWRRALDKDRRGALRRDEIAKLRHMTPLYHRAVSSVPAREFGHGASRGRPADADIARKALAGEPVLGKLPVRPVDGGGAEGPPSLRERAAAGRATGSTRGDKETARADASGAPTGRPTERPTGAASRRPGVALDEELRRGRIFNNREPLTGKLIKTAPGDDPTRGDERNTGGGGRGGAGEGGGTGEGRGTGAVARPERRVRVPDSSAGGDQIIDKRANDRVRPVRPVPEAEGGAEVKRPEWKERPVTRPGRPDSEGDGARERPTSRPEVRDVKPERPEPRREERQEKRERPEPRYERPERQERPEPRQERQERQERHSPPPQREERQPPPQREERQAPPQREERSAPPPREERSPPPQREEKRSEPPRPASERPSRGKHNH